REEFGTALFYPALEVGEGDSVWPRERLIIRREDRHRRILFRYFFGVPRQLGWIWRKRIRHELLRIVEHHHVAAALDVVEQPLIVGPEIVADGVRTSAGHDGVEGREIGA